MDASRSRYRLGALAATLCACMVGACAAPGPRRDPMPAPGTELKAVEAFERGREAFRTGDLHGAQALFRTAILTDDSMVKAHIHYQETWIRRRRRGTALDEYRRRLEHDRTGINVYLHGRLLEEPRRRLVALNEAIQRNPYLSWAFLERALIHESFGERDAAEADMDRAVKLSPREATFLVHRGKFYLRRREPHLAMRSYYNAMRFDADSDAACYGLFTTHLRHGSHQNAMDRLKQCIAMRPTHALYHRKLRQYGDRHASRRDLERLEERLLDKRAAHPDNAEIIHTLGWIAMRTGRPFAAIRSLEAAARLGAEMVEVTRDLIRADVQVGRYAAALARFHAYAPASVLLDAGNRLRPRWRELAAATAAAGPDPDAAALHRLARAHAAVGWVREALQVYDRVKLAAADRPGIDAEIERCAKFAKFLEVLGGYFDARYEAFKRGAPRSLADVLRDLSRYADRHAGVKSPGPLPMKSFGILGRLIDREAAADHPLVRYLDDFNHYLVVGQRNGGPPEAFVCARLYLDPEAMRPRFGRRVRHRYLLGHDVKVRSFREAYQQHLGGAAFGREFFVNMDFVQRWRQGVAGTFRAFGSPEGLEDLFHDRAMPAASAEEALDLGNPLSLRARLFYLHCKEAGGRVGDPAVFVDMVRSHEEGHVLDAARYLPILSNLWRNLGLVFANGLSATDVEGYLEGNAELTALAEGRSPRLSLAQLIGFLPNADAAPPHSRGYHAVVGDIVKEVYEHPERYPRIDRKRNILQQLHRLTPDQLRSIARRLAAGRALTR